MRHIYQHLELLQTGCIFEGDMIRMWFTLIKTRWANVCDDGTSLKHHLLNAVGETV